jgi:Na+/phosphate symporter
VRLAPGLRRAILATHLALSVGWIGAILAYLPFDLVTATSDEPASLRAAYAAMSLIAGAVIRPLAIGAFLTGIVVSLSTTWGLVRHWWVAISLLMTALATIVLLIEIETIEAYAAVAADPAATADRLQGLGSTLVHSVGGLLVLLVVLVMNVYKPRGLTPYGWRKQHQTASTFRQG